MQKNMPILFLLLSNLLITCDVSNTQFLSSDKVLNDLDETLNYSLVYIHENVKKSILELMQLLNHYTWSDDLKNLCKDVSQGSMVAPYHLVMRVIDECLEACKDVSCPDTKMLQDELQNYKIKLEMGHAHFNIAK